MIRLYTKYIEIVTVVMSGMDQRKWSEEELCSPRKWVKMFKGMIIETLEAQYEPGQFL